MKQTNYLHNTFVGAPWKTYDSGEGDDLPIIVMGWDNDAEESFDIAHVQVDGLSRPEQEAISRLIAAAPNMYTILQAICDIPEDQESELQKQANDLLCWVKGEGYEPDRNL